MNEKLDNIRKSKKMNNKDSLNEPNNEIVEKILKKRGRKPKDKSETIVKVNLDTEENMDSVMILHIPLIEENIEIQKNHLLSNNDVISNYNNNDNCVLNENILNDNNFYINYESNTENLHNKNYNCNNHDNTHSQYLNDIINTSGLFNDMTNHKKNLNFFNNTLNQRSLYEINGIENENSETHYCYWDTCSFQSKPIGLPFKRLVYKCQETNKLKHKYIVFGYFCSFGCMASYNYSMKDLQMNERFLLINSLYKETYGVEKLITFAPPREMLDKFGGPYNIHKYRSVSNSDINIYYQKIIPPMFSMKFQIEEFYGKLYNRKENENQYKNNLNGNMDKNDTSIYLDSERIFKAQERFMNNEKLKYNKKNNNNCGNENDEIKYTIENRMGIILKKN